MALIGRLAKFAGKKFGRKGVKKALSSKQKLALAKAVKASALKRRKSVTKAVSKRVTKKAAPKLNKLARRAAAISKTDKLGLKRVAKGTRGYAGQKRISNSLNFGGQGGKALKKSTYKARLASSRAKYKNSNLADRGMQKLIGVGLPSQGIWRRKYVDLTVGENVRRNFTRNLKVTSATLGAVAGTMNSNNISEGLEQKYTKAKNTVKDVLK
jgi:hypothetical protein